MRMLVIAAVLGTAAASTPASAASRHAHPSHASAWPAKPLSPVGKLVATARANYLRREKDQYANDIKSDVAEGTPFVINFKADDVRHTDSLVSYLNGHLNFALTPTQTPRDVFHVDREQYDLLRVGATSRSSQWVGSNAFGAARVVDSYQDRSTAIALLTVPEGAEYNMFSYMMSDVPGSVARRLVANARVVVEGTIAALPDGKLAECRLSHIEATLDAPTEIKDLICYAGAHVTRIAFVNVATGEVIKEWIAQGQVGNDASRTSP